MPAHRKSIEAHELSGAVAKNPQRFTKRKSEPRPSSPLGTAPKHLSATEKKVWREIQANAPAGSLGSSDRLILEIVCRLTVNFRDGKLTRASEISQLINGLGRLGLTPADRAKINVDHEPSTKPVDDQFSFLQ